MSLKEKQEMPCSEMELGTQEISFKVDLQCTQFDTAHDSNAEFKN
jgi:hypothetical protein